MSPKVTSMILWKLLREFFRSFLEISSRNSFKKFVRTSSGYFSVFFSWNSWKSFLKYLWVSLFKNSSRVLEITQEFFEHSSKSLCYFFLEVHSTASQLLGEFLLFFFSWVSSGILRMSSIKTSPWCSPKNLHRLRSRIPPTVLTRISQRIFSWIRSKVLSDFF